MSVETFHYFQSAEYTKWRDPLEYPQNLMRNIAKSGCQTNYTFIPDVDMIPNQRLDLSLENFLVSFNIYLAFLSFFLSFFLNYLLDCFILID